MNQILFVCTGNRYRSVIAAACFREELSRRKQEKSWTILSAGTWTTDGMPPMKDAIQRAKHIGLDIQEHRSRAITADMLAHADFVLVMESGQKEALQVEFPFCREKILLLSEAAQGTSYDIPDPASHPANVDVVSEICQLIHTGFDKICALAGTTSSLNLEQS
jgi:protein-tyrosine phosphatase